MTKMQVMGLIFFVNAKVLLLIYALDDPNLVLLLASFGGSMIGIAFMIIGAKGEGI